jgi:hypothetical protein
MRRFGLLAGLIAVVFVGQGFAPAFAGTLPPPPGLPSQIRFSVCPNVQVGVPVFNAAYGLYTGATEVGLALPPPGCQAPVYSPGAVLQGCVPAPATTSLGTFSTGDNPLGLYVGINTAVSSNGDCLGPGAGNLRTSPPFDILASFANVGTGQFYAEAANAEGPNGALFQVGTFAPGTYTVSVFFQGGGPDANGNVWAQSSATGTVTVTAPPPLPTSSDQCKNGGWQNFGGIFKNQGDCVSFVATHAKNPPG